MNARPFQTARFPKNRHPAGFALVVTLSLMILLTVIAVGLLSMSSVSMRKTNTEQPMAAARANAKLGLDLALDELQKAAGPDQRITAAADILSGNNTATNGRKRWVGVWNTSTYSPATPDTKAFVRWLVSSNENTSTVPNTPNLTMVASDPATTDYEIFKAVDASGNSSASNSVKVPKVEISSNSSTSKHYYAYWVEDEGLKADLGWKEGNATTSELKQAARLSAAPGVDYGVFGGPFTSSNVKYPITKDSLTDNPWLANIDKALSPADMPLVMSSNSSLSNWLKSTRHDVTLGSLGVMADVKKGGLRRDLSLAFEMDGTAESGNATTKFNAQDGEFVGGNDRLTAPQVAPGMPVKERFLYRDTKLSGATFSNDMQPAPSVVRGPNWWALRDYANLYKRLTGTSGNYTLKARSYYPNRSGGATSLGEITQTSTGGNWDRETGGAGRYIYRPARSNYAPVLLGSVCLYSAKVTGGKLALGIDSFFYLWNPFNRSLKVDKFAIFADQGLVGDVTFKVTKPDGTTTTYGPAPIWDYLRKNSSVDTYNIVYLASNLTMAPGEIVVVSPISAPSKLKFETTPGTNIDDASGIILTKLPSTWAEVSLNPTDMVSMQYVSSAGGGRYWLRTTLPPSNATPSSFGGTGSGNSPNAGDELQALDANFLADNTKLPEYFYPSQNSGVMVGPYAANTLVNTKNFFGIQTYLIKSANHVGNNPNPVEVFSQFNPAPVGSLNKDVWRVCHLNQTFNTVSRAGGFNALLQEVGIGFPATALNNGFWGASYSFGGSTAVPIKDIPSAPIFSLSSYSHAALATRISEPYHAVGNSWASVFVPPVSPYGVYAGAGAPSLTASDSSWLLNDALFDRYYLSGIAPAFTIGSGGYTANGTINDTLTKFFSSDYKSAQANPVLRPYLPPGGNSSAAVSSLAADDGYKKTGAYSLIDGAFNVNSTSVSAWTAFLRANRSLAVTYAQGGSDSAAGTPFPGSTSPSNPSGIPDFWSGFSRLTDAQVTALAEEIVNQVKLRGPFMSLSDFVNHRVGTPKTTANDMGALQAAIEAANINSAVRAGAGGTTPVYTTPGAPAGSGAQYFMPGNTTAGNRTTTTNIPTDITQAKLLEPLAPRLSARSDTFRIRSYGEVRSADGSKVISYAMCEAIVQRVPEYFDPVTDAANNEPWDEGATLNQTNKTFGRRFNVISFRWLNPNEI